MKAIDIFIVNFEGRLITYTRIANYLGWFAEGKGDFINCSDPVLTDEILCENCCILSDQIADTLTSNPDDMVKMSLFLRDKVKKHFKNLWQTEKK